MAQYGYVTPECTAGCSGAARQRQPTTTANHDSLADTADERTPLTTAKVVHSMEADCHPDPERAVATMPTEVVMTDMHVRQHVRVAVF